MYNDAVDLLLDWWESLKSRSLTELLAVSKERLLHVLSELAFDVHKHQKDLAGTADIAERDLVSRLLAISANPDLRPLDLTDFFNQQRTGLLTPRGVGVFSFPHRTFQEYLAACALTEGDDFPENVADEVHTDPERWREVALLAGAKAARGAKASIWLLTEALCYDDLPWNIAGVFDETTIGIAAARGEQVVQNAWGALLAGQMLLESADLRSVSFRHQPKLERVRRWLAAILTEQVELKPEEPFPAVERALAGRLLATLDDPRPGVGLREDGLPDIAWLAIPAGAFTMGSDPIDVSTLAEEELERWQPITYADYRSFIQADGYEEQRYWTSTGWQWRKKHGDESRTQIRTRLDALEDNSSDQPVSELCEHEVSAFLRWVTEVFNRFEQPAHSVRTPAFQISRYPITNAQYQAFVDDGGYTEKWRQCWTKEGWEWKGEREQPAKGGGNFDLANHPVIGVTWYESVAFCHWLTKLLQAVGTLREDEVIRLPSEAEWEYAARGPENYIYPWGNDAPDPEWANYRDTNLGETSAVGCFPRGQKPLFRLRGDGRQCVGMVSG